MFENKKLDEMAFLQKLDAEKNDFLLDLKALETGAIEGIILNRQWLYAEGNTEEPIGEVNFIVEEPWLAQYWAEHFKKSEEDTFDDFLDVYVPEEDGEQIYLAAKTAGTLMMDVGEYMYN